ncbi:MAG: AmmeMemoRadiSam system protein A [Phycisphaerae bacterium]
MTPHQEQTVLSIAREAMERAARGQGYTPPEGLDLPADFGGVFVTLRQGGRLRGCMGTFAPTGSLAETVARVARMSCQDDPRFADNRITPAQLGDIRVEVSVLETPYLTDDPAATLEVGKHGVWIRQGPASGVLLPQVAVERRWGPEEFLKQCCVLKAGLPPLAWKDANTQIYLFGAHIICEPD